ncbi:MAG TPA: signal peptidase I [Candidatus Nanoarchaeia archaeon]|nr:signal peptidase I [Candidatus Nanoarchaeia archaeon]
MSFKETLKKIWDFIWHDNSIWSWIVNVILAFVLVKWVIYPAIGIIFSTSFPIVAVVSESMEHNGLDLDTWWNQNKQWYSENGFTKDDFKEYRFKNGFNKGDIMLLRGKEPKDIKRGDVLVYETSLYDNPVIHRVVGVENNSSGMFFTTKGDNNAGPDNRVVTEEQIKRTGTAYARIPLLGWIKIIFVETLRR